MDTEDAATVLLRFGPRTRGLMQVSQVARGASAGWRSRSTAPAARWPGTPSGPTSCGSAIATAPNELLIKDPALLDEPARSVARYPGGHDEGFPDSHTAINRAIYDYIRAGGHASGGRPAFPTFVDGHRENLIADAVLESARESRWVPVEVPPMDA